MAEFEVDGMISAALQAPLQITVAPKDAIPNYFVYWDSVPFAASTSRIEQLIFPRDIFQVLLSVEAWNSFQQS
jgi:hypothetical protein